MNLENETKKILSLADASQVNETISTHESLSATEIIRNAIDDYEPDVQDRLDQEFFGLGPLNTLVQNSLITEIIITPDVIIYEASGKLKTLDSKFLSQFTFNQFIHRLSEESRCFTDMKTPYKDGVWRDFRVHIIQSPLSQPELIVTLRRQSRDNWTLDSLEGIEFLSAQENKLFRDIYSQKKNLLIVGATGSGKTTLINALIGLSPTDERVIIIEDTDELHIPHKACSKLLTRSSNSENLPDIQLQDLLRQSLRMRPDRIILGEVRGEEAKDLLLTLSTGHSGFLGSLHARNSKEALWRLEMLIQMGAPQWSVDTIRKLISFSIDGIVVVGKDNKKRRITEVMRLVSLEQNGFLLEPYIF